MIIRELFTLLGFKFDEKSAQSAKDSLTEIKTIAIGVSAAVSAIGAVLTKAVVDFAAYAGGVKDTSEITDVATETIQEYANAARLAGVANGAIEKTFITLGAAASGLTAKGKATVELLREIGVSVKDAGGKALPANEIFDRLVSKLAAIPDPGKRAAAAVKVLGGTGQELLPFLAKGADGVAKLREEAYELGSVFEDNLIDQGDELGDNLDRLSLVAASLYRLLGSSLTPAVNKVVAGVITWRKENDALIRTGVTAFALDFVNVLGSVADVGSRAVNMAVNIVNSFGGVRNVLIASAIGAAILNAALLPAILTAAAFAAGFALIALIIEDVSVYEKYGNSAKTVTGILMDLFVDQPLKWSDGPLITAVKLLAKGLKEVRDFAAGAGEGLAQMFEGAQIASDKLFGTDYAPLGRAEEFRRQGQEKYARDARAAGVPEQEISRMVGRDTLVGPRQAPMQSIDPTAAALAQPWIAPMSLQAGTAKTITDARTIGPFYINTSDPKDAADQVADRLRDLNVSQIVD